MPRSILAIAAMLSLASVGAHAMPGATRVMAAPKESTKSRKNIAIGHFQGPKASKIRLALMQALKESPSFTVTDAEDLKSSGGKKGIAKAAAALQLDAVVFGKISFRYDLTVSVYKPDGRLVDQIKVKGGSTIKLEQAIKDEFDDAIAPPLAEASGAKLVAGDAEESAAPEEEEEPEAPAAPASAAETPPETAAETAAEDEKVEDKAPEEAPAPKKTRYSALELAAGMRGYSRRFLYTDVHGVRDPSQPRTLRPYRLDFAPEVVLGGTLYPGAFFTDGVGAHIGITGDFNIGLATSTDYEQVQPDNSRLVTTLSTTAQAWDVGLRGRLPLGPVEIGVFAEYGAQAFIIHGDEGNPGQLSPLVPDVKYTFLRFGLEPRARFGRLILGAHLAPRVLLSLHQIDLERVWFPGARGSGLDFGLMAGAQLTPFLDVIGGGDFVGYGFDFNGLPTDPVRAPVVAGGATDRYLSLWIALQLRIAGAPAKKP